MSGKQDSRKPENGAYNPKRDNGNWPRHAPLHTFAITWSNRLRAKQTSATPWAGSSLTQESRARASAILSPGKQLVGEKGDFFLFSHPLAFDKCTASQRSQRLDMCRRRRQPERGNQVNRQPVLAYQVIDIEHELDVGDNIPPGLALYIIELFHRLTVEEATTELGHLREYFRQVREASQADRPELEQRYSREATARFGQIVAADPSRRAPAE